MRVLTLEVHNIQRVRDVKFNLDGANLFLVGGKNDQGKTSALTALTMALCGKSGSDYPEMPLKNGETKGWIKVKLSGDEELHEPDSLMVELLLRRKRDSTVVEEFRILDSAGEEAPEPRTLLKRLYEMRAFDPLSFENLDRKAKKALLEKLLHLDFTEQKIDRKQIYDDRTAVNKEGIRRKAQYDAMPDYKDVPAEEISTADLMTTLENRQESNKNNRIARDDFKKSEKSLQEKREDATALASQISNLQSQLDRVEEDISVAESIAERRKVVIDGLVDLDEGEIAQQIKEADGTNAKVRANNDRILVAREVQGLRSKSEDLGKKITAIDEAQHETIAKTKFPVEGLAFDDEGVTLNGLPFEQASTAQRILTSVAVGMALNPKLKLLVCQDGNRLDEESLAALEDILIEKDYQMIVEFVTRTAADEDICSVVIKDGEVVS